MSENRAFFRATAERILADTLSPADIEAAERRIIPAALYKTFEEAGILSMLMPEGRGGIGASVADATAILRAAGSAAAPGPLLETMLARALLARAGLEPVNDLIALAFVPTVAYPLVVGVSDWVAPETLYDVPWGGSVKYVLIVSRANEAVRISLTQSVAWTVAKGSDAAGEPRDSLSAEKISATTGTIATSLDDLLQMASVLRAGQILGAIEWAFSRSVEYAGERKQFGREISKFQVIQQMLAELADHVLASGGITEAAAEGFSPTLVAAARSRLGDAADAAIAISHQVHGAIGVSREYALNYRTRRLMAWRDDYGSVLSWRRILTEKFVSYNRETFWPALADAGLQKRI